jgi:hypothetical protein
VRLRPGYWPGGGARALTHPCSTCNPAGLAVCGVAVVPFDPDPEPDAGGLVVVVVLGGGTAVEGTVVVVVVVVVDVGTLTGGTFTAGTVVGMVLVVVVDVGGTVVLVVVVGAAAGSVVVVVVVVVVGVLPAWPAAGEPGTGAPGADTVMTAVVHAPALCMVATSSTSRARARVSAVLSDARVVVARETALTAASRRDWSAFSVATAA